MKDRIKQGFDWMAIFYLAIVVICSLLSGPILSGLSMNPDIQLTNANLPPFQEEGLLLGTDYLGRNIFALIVNGAKYSFSISVFSALMGTAIGVIFGAIGGFYGDDKVSVRRATLLTILMLTPLYIHYLSLSVDLEGSSSGFLLLLSTIGILLVGKLLVPVFKKVAFLRLSLPLPLDFLNMKFIEILFAVPTYFVLLALSGIFDPSVYSLIVIIGITSWPKTSLLIRNEMLKIRSMDFIHALKLAGVPWYRVLFRHAIPNAISPVLVNFVFFATGLLVVESTLSFVGIGLPGDIISWGKILAGYKQNSANWWTVLFPGMVIFLTILSFHRVGKMIKKVRVQD